ncbi:RIMS binding protein isoform X2 [Dermatophagoides farinae]|uniref:RIMS binding protein isoform X2 n=1 Tax=Dermatophagoides farinae TaxID=6954 RepID=UPI003F5E3176
MNTIISKLEQDDRILAELDNQLRSVSNRSSRIGHTSSSTPPPPPLLLDTNNNNDNSSNQHHHHERINLVNTNKHSKHPPLSIDIDDNKKSIVRHSSQQQQQHLSSNRLPSSTNEINEWKYQQDYQSVLNTTTTADHIGHRNDNDDDDDDEFCFQNEKSQKASSSNASNISTELKRIEDKLATVINRSSSSIGQRKHLSNNVDHHHHHKKILANLDAQEQQQQPSFNKSTAHLFTMKTKMDNYSMMTDKKLNINEKQKSTTSNVSSKDLDLLMEKLERDNKILAELDKKLKNVSTTSVHGEEISGGQLLSSSLPSYAATQLPKTSILNDQHYIISKSSNPLINTSSSNNPVIFPSSTIINRISSSSAAVATTTTATGQRVLPMTESSYTAQIDELKEAEEIVDSIELPNRGRCKVFMAKYNYDPYKNSPNDNPETEVTLLAGDFILIFGNIDEDGYYYGELLDGRRGLVPSNFIEKLTGDDLFEFQARVLYGHNKDAESDTASFPPEFYDAILSEQIGHTSFQHLLAPDDFHRINDYIDLEDATEIDEDVSEPERAEQEAAKTTVPPPQRLIVERQLHKSVLIGWLHPECPRTMIDHYQIYVDGVLKATIPSGDRTKALVEGVDSSMPHRISIRAIDRNGRHSKDPGCTIVIGKNIPFAPCCVKASNITSDSALISWIPCNSNFYHVVAVNSVEVRTVKPSVFKHLIVGLSANTLYRVSVRAKPGKLLCSDEKNPKKLEMLTTFVDFRTLPKSLPDPPVDIQVEAGPQEGTLLVTWLPITLNQFGTSNNCPVTGYAVFAGHKKLAEIDSPTGDHALLDIASLEHLHKKLITVRTKSGENLSQDSMPCQIPDDLLKLQLMANTTQQLKKNTQYDMRHRMLTNRQQQQQQQQTTNVNRMVGAGRMATNRNVHTSSLHMNDNMARMTIPAIEITKETPSESVQPMESYSEEEFDQSMKQRIYGGKRTGVSPMPPQRTRVLSEYERSNLGPYNQLTHRRQPNQRDREHGVRWFVALFDYDPMTMSPNPDAAEEELPFQEGQLIKIYGDKDADGFYRGECNGRIGYVPCNMVSEVQYDVENDPRFRNNPNDPLSHLSIRKMIALYDYDPQELSPNFDTEVKMMSGTQMVPGQLQTTRQMNTNNAMATMAHGQLISTGGMGQGQLGQMQVLQPGTASQQQQQFQQGLQQQLQSHQQQPFNQTGTQNFSNTGQTTGGLLQNTMQATQQPQGLSQQQMLMQQQSHLPQSTMQQQTTQYHQQIGTQPLVTTGQGVNQQQQQMFQGQGQQGVFQQQPHLTTQQQILTQQQQNASLQANQSMMGRVMRQQNPMVNVTGVHQAPGQQGPYNPMFQGPGTNLGNKQRPNSLDLNMSTTPRFGQQMVNQTGLGPGGPMGTGQPGQLPLPNQHHQQQQSTGMLGSLFASGKKILEEATTPLGARGPFAHPNQPHQPMMGHHQPQSTVATMQQNTMIGGQQQPQQQHQQPSQQTQMNFGQPQHPNPQQQQQSAYNPMLGNQANQPGQAAGTIMNTMKSLFKL